MRTRLGALVMMLVAAAVAGCAGPVGGEAEPADASAAADRWTACPALEYIGREPAGVHAPVPLGNEFVPAAAVVCDFRNEPTGRGGENLVLVEGRTREIAGLVAALRLP